MDAVSCSGGPPFVIIVLLVLVLVLVQVPVLVLVVVAFLVVLVVGTWEKAMQAIIVLVHSDDLFDMQQFSFLSAPSSSPRLSPAQGPKWHRYESSNLVRIKFSWEGGCRVIVVELSRHESGTEENQRRAFEQRMCAVVAVVSRDGQVM